MIQKILDLQLQGSFKYTTLRLGVKGPQTSNPENIHSSQPNPVLLFRQYYPNYGNNFLVCFNGKRDESRCTLMLFL